MGRHRLSGTPRRAGRAPWVVLACAVALAGLLGTAVLATSALDRSANVATVHPTPPAGTAPPEPPPALPEPPRALPPAAPSVSPPVTSVSPVPPVSPVSPPCPPSFRVCVSLGAGQAWLRDAEGRELVGPVPIAAGSAELPTPPGDYTVLWKDVDHVSSLYAGSPMPFAVFFDDRGYALHEGHLGKHSAGCVRLDPVAAERFYAELTVGDPVRILP